MTPFLTPLLAQVSRGTGAFLGIAIPIALLLVAFSLRWIGKKSWPRSLAGAFVGFLCYPLAIGLLIWAFTSEKYGELLAWSMMFGLPLVLGLLLLILAWFVNVAILCWFGGMRGGLITGFVVLPLMWSLCFGMGGANLLGLYEEKRESIDPVDAVERGDYEYLGKSIGKEQANELWKLSFIWLDPKSAEIALRLGADVNGIMTLVNGIPQTPLQIALNPLSYEALKKPDLPGRKLAMVDLLLRHKADPNLAGRPGEEPLLLAINRVGDPGMVKKLLNAGAKLSQETPALHLAASTKFPGSVEMVKLLLETGVDINGVRPRDQRTPLQCAATGLPETLKLLVEKGAQVRPEPLAKPDEAPILIAVLGGRPDNALALLELGADPFARTEDGLSAWQISRDPMLRKALEAKGVPPEVPLADLVSKEGETVDWLFQAFSRNTSVYRVLGALSAQLTGAGPWDIRVLFPGDKEPVVLKGVTSIELQELGSNAQGGERVVKNTVWLGDKNPPPGLKSRKLEKMKPFSAQVQLGYAIVFRYES